MSIYERLKFERHSHRIPCQCLKFEKYSHSIPCQCLKFDRYSHSIPCQWLIWCITYYGTECPVSWWWWLAYFAAIVHTFHGSAYVYLFSNDVLRPFTLSSSYLHPSLVKLVKVAIYTSVNVWRFDCNFLVYVNWIFYLGVKNNWHGS